MKASEINYQTGDKGYIETSWGDKEYGTVIGIPDGAEVTEIDIEFEDGSMGVYRPEDFTRTEG